MAMQYEALVHPRASRRWEVGNRSEDGSPGKTDMIGPARLVVPFNAGSARTSPS